MTDTMLDSPRANGRAHPGRSPSSLVAGVAGLVAVLVGVTQLAFVGEVPGLGDSAAEVAAYFADNTAAHKIGVVVPALLAIPIALFFVGVYRTIATADTDRSSFWGTLFLFGAIMMSATAGLSEGLFAIPVLREGSGLEPATLRMLNDGSQIARATVGVWSAVALGGVAAATFTLRYRARWYGWFCALAAVFGVLGVIDTVSTETGGIFAEFAFLFGFILWIVVTSILMLRDRD